MLSFSSIANIEKGQVKSRGSCNEEFIINNAVWKQIDNK